MDTSDPKAPKVVHAFMSRDSKGYTIKETWDVLGMRATRSDDTVLDRVFVPYRYVARVVQAGAAGLDLFVLSIFAGARGRPLPPLGQADAGHRPGSLTVVGAGSMLRPNQT